MTVVTIRIAAVALATLLGAAGAASPARAQEQCEGTAGAGMTKLVVLATDVRNNTGEVAFTLYPDDRGRFLSKGGKIGRVRARAQAGVTRACFWVRPGYYAIANYHDENNDHNFNRTLFSIKEGFGFSNDAPTTFGLPSFNAVRFAVPSGGAAIRVKMRYQR